jgi:hypothetical protein
MYGDLSLEFEELSNDFHEVEDEKSTAKLVIAIILIFLVLSLVGFVICCVGIKWKSLF